MNDWWIFGWTVSLSIANVSEMIDSILWSNIVSMSSASDSHGSHLWDSAYDSSLCLDVQQSDEHVFISLLQLSGVDGSWPVPCLLPAQSGAQESQRGEMHLCPRYKLSDVVHVLGVQGKPPSPLLTGLNTVHLRCFWRHTAQSHPSPSLWSLSWVE